MSAGQPPLKVGIAGLGRAGALAPAVPAPAGGEPVIRNHLAAVVSTPAYEIAALVEPDRERLNQAVGLYPAAGKARAYDALADLPAGELDVLILCTPTDSRRQDVLTALSRRPRLLVVEKPLAADTDTGEALLQAAAAAGCALRINFNRRFDGPIQRFWGAIGGAPNAALCRYTTGLMNYGSHMVDLLTYWFGPVRAVQAIGASSSDADPLISFSCQMDAGWPAHVLALPGVAYDQFEMEFYLPDGCARLVNNGVDKHYYRISSDLYYPGYAHLSEAPEYRDATPTGGFAEFHRLAASALHASTDVPGCTGSEALANLRLLEAVRESAASGGRVVQLPAAAGPSSAE